MGHRTSNSAPCPLLLLVAALSVAIVAHAASFTIPITPKYPRTTPGRYAAQRLRIRMRPAARRLVAVSDAKSTARTNVASGVGKRGVGNTEATLVIQKPNFIGQEVIYIEDGMRETSTVAANFEKPSAKACDITMGSWEEDKSWPLYSGLECPYIFRASQCAAHGRPDTKFQTLRWRPAGLNVNSRENTDAGSCAAMPQLTRRTACSIMKNRNIAYVGDSLTRNHFQSLACVMHGTQGPPTVRNAHPYAQVYHWPSCNATVAFYWSYFLSNLTLNDPQAYNKGGELNLDSADDWWSKHIHEHDTFVLSSGQWWTAPRIQGRGIQFNAPHRSVNMLDAYRRGLESALRPFSAPESSGKQVVVSMVMPGHGGKGVCTATEPYPADVAGRKTWPEERWNAVARDVARRAEGERVRRGYGAPVLLLDNFAMTSRRQDGHAGLYTGENHSDCGHYCLPGAPDSWNEADRKSVV